MLVDIYEVGGKTCACVSLPHMADVFGIEHEDALESVRELKASLDQESFSSLFLEVEYIDPSKCSGEDEPETEQVFAMNKDGFALLAMKLRLEEKQMKRVLYCLQHFSIVEDTIHVERTMELVRDAVIEHGGSVDDVQKFIKDNMPRFRLESKK